MATLVLSTVGQVVGGPIGQSIGAIIGQTIDNEILFKPKGREGPRLTQLSVQTSTYGSEIARLYGTIRVAGTVIWASDLIERSSRSGGKGRPSVTTYSYAASFAVLLSARGVRGVKRIWADGTLLRGAAGDFKVRTGFRLHTGDEDQAVDPLIASAEGIAMTPAHRGMAYAVFEGLELAEFGNRIPSLTFEVEADADDVTAGAIIADVAGGRIAASAVDVPVVGFSAYGGSARAVIDQIGQAAGIWYAPDDGGLSARTGEGTALPVEDEGAGVGTAPGVSGVRAISPVDGVPRSLSVAHYDAARDYQIGLQRAVRPGPGERAERIELAAVLDAGVAKRLAEGALARAEGGRVTRRVAVDWRGIAMVPGARVTLNGEPGQWVVAGWNLEAMVLHLDLVPIAAGVGAASASGGRVAGAPDLIHGATILHAFELPPVEDVLLSAPRLMIAAAGEQAGWRSAALLVSEDGGVSWREAGGTAPPAVIGTVVVVPGATSAMIEDRVSVIVVDLAHDAMELGDADDAAMDAGANLALVGDELIQFGRAEQIAPTQWRLSRLWRGRRGTEWAMADHATGERFVVIAAAMLASVDLLPSAVGTGVPVRASGVGDPVDADPVVAVVDGRSVVPPSPVHLTATAQEDGSVVLQWVRRSRGGWRWIDAVDAPLGEEREYYRVELNGSGTMRSVEVDAPAITLDAVDMTGIEQVTVRQIGTHGVSRATGIAVG